MQREVPRRRTGKMPLRRRHLSSFSLAHFSHFVLFSLKKILFSVLLRTPGFTKPSHCHNVNSVLLSMGGRGTRREKGVIQVG